MSGQVLSEALNSLDTSLKVIPRDVYKRISAVHNANVDDLGLEKPLENC